MIFMHIFNNKILKRCDILLIITFKILYDIIINYQLPVAIALSNHNYRINPNEFKILLGYLLLGFSLAFTNKMNSKSTVAYISIAVLYFLYYIPVISVFGQCDLPYEFFFLINFYWFCLIIFTNLICVKNIHGIVLNKVHFGINHAFFVLFVFATISTYLYNGFNFTLDFADVYEVREESLNANYFLLLAKNAYVMFLGPVFISYYLIKKEYLWAFYAIALMVIFFTVGKDKSAVFIIFPVIIMSFLRRINYITIKVLIGFSLCILMIISYVEYIHYDSHNICYFIIRRTFFVPSFFNFLYYDFFSEATKLYFTDHVFLINRILPDIYPYNVSELISRKYFSGLTSSPNTGMFAEGYMQLGILGAIIYPIILAYFFKFLDRITCFYPLILRVATAITICLVLINVPITHSFFVVTFGVASFFMILVNTEFNKYPV